MTSAGLAVAGEAAIASMTALGGDCGVASSAAVGSAAKIVSGKTSEKAAARWRRTGCIEKLVTLRGVASVGQEGRNAAIERAGVFCHYGSRLGRVHRQSQRNFPRPK